MEHNQIFNQAEHKIQNDIRVYISENHLGTFFRANVGTGWVGRTYINESNNCLRILHPRRFSTGLPDGFPDLFGFREITVTPEMVGQKIAVFCGLEIKSPHGALRKKQRLMLDYMAQNHCYCGVARSVNDAERILSGEHYGY